ncbi:MAG: AAA family ATPase [Sediminibacterium sp.]|nr:AAA family ATPase [Sediminibacterium sp.]MDP3128918.1 AAA family ATPase [Sediminibacterium sp.]
MNITKFKIQNFRSLKEIEVTEFTSTTIFYGENNAGKSNILNALNLIFSRKPKLVSEDTLSQLENFYSGVLRSSQNSFYNNDTSQPIKFEVEIEILKSELSINTEIESLFKTGTSFKFAFSGSIKFVDFSELDYSEFKIETILKGKDVLYSNNTDISYFPSFDKKRSKQAQLEKAFTQLVDIFNDCVYVVGSDRDMHETTLLGEDVNYLSPKTFKKFLYSLYLSPKKFVLFEQINSVYSNPPFSFGTISFSDDNGKLEIMIKEKDIRLPIKYLGSGALQSLYIISSIICNKGKIVCLEELEQNLSPRKQFEILNKVQGMIKDPKLSLTQLIISSHSSVYAKPKLGTIYFLEKKDGKTTINSKETKKISKKMQGHLAPSQGEWDESQMKEIKRILKEEHDFE